MSNDLLNELAELTAEQLEQNDARANRRKPEWVKLYNEFTADTTVTVGTTDKGGEMFVLNWTNMNILAADTPVTIEEDSEEFPVSRNKDGSVRGSTKAGFLLKSLSAIGKNIKDLDGGKKVHYKLNLWQQKNADGTVRLNEKGYPAYEVWYWDVVAIGGAATNGAKAAPVFSDAQMDDAAAVCAGLSSEEALKALVAAGYPGNDMLSKLLVGSTKRLRQVEGVYELIELIA